MKIYFPTLYNMKQAMSEITILILMFSWLAGIGLAHGVLSSFIACIFPFYAWYLVVVQLIGIFL